MFGIHKSRYTYWTHAKPVDWIREKFGPERPTYATAEDWDKYREEWETKYPRLNWWTDDFIDRIQDVCYFPRDLWKHIYHKLNARFNDQYYLGKSDLNKWEYHEIDTRMLHINFQMLVDFIEVERCGYKNEKWYQRGYASFIFGKLRDPVEGMNNLEWETELKFDESYYGPGWTKEQVMKEFGDRYGQDTPQAEKAKEILALYYWWKARPARPDPYEESGYNKIAAEEEYKITKKRRLSFQLSKEMSEAYDRIHEIEEKYAKEDDEMLAKLISIRRSLWS
jgi:hypothetical protein